MSLERIGFTGSTQTTAAPVKTSNIQGTLNLLNPTTTSVRYILEPSGGLRFTNPQTVRTLDSLRQNSETFLYDCPESPGTYLESVAVLGRVFDTQLNAEVSLEIAKIPVNFVCTSTTLELLSSPVKETIEGYTEGGTFIYEKRFVTTVVKNKSVQVLNYKATSLQPFNKILKETREVPASSRDFVDLLLECPDGAGSYAGSTDLISNDVSPITYASVPVELECLESPKPTLTPAEANQPAIGGAQSDPHMFTFDGMHYEGQKAGEFILAKSLLSDGFEIQARFEDVSDSQVWSATTALALRLEGFRIGVYLKNGNWSFRVNGVEVFLQNGTYDVGNGIKISGLGNDFSISSKNGFAVRFNGSSSIDYMQVMIPPRIRGQVRGWLGDADGNEFNDFRLRNGVQLKSPIDITKLMDFLESWRINLGESLFDYESGTSNLGFTNINFPQDKKYFDIFAPIAQLPVEARAKAEDICKDAKIITPEIFRNCVFDVGLTGDEIWARVAEKVDPANLFVAIVPSNIILNVDEFTDLYAFATHKKAVAELIWSSTGGVLTVLGEGIVRFNASSVIGSFRVRASLQDDPSIFDEISITVLPRRVEYVRWSPDGQKLAYSGAGTWVIDSNTRQELTALTGDSAAELNWNSNNLQLWTGNYVVWNVLTNASQYLEGSAVFDWSPDGRFVVTSNFDSPTVIRDAVSGEQLRVLSTLSAEFVDWSADGSRVAIGNGFYLEIWDVQLNQLVYEESSPLINHKYLFGLSFSPDSSRLMLKVERDPGYSLEIEILDARTGMKLQSSRCGYLSECGVARWSPDSNSIAFANYQFGGATMKIYDSSTFSEIQSFDELIGKVKSLDWHPNGRWLAVVEANNQVSVWDVQTKLLVFRL
jgi:WD40 repeat protein